MTEEPQVKLFFDILGSIFPSLLKDRKVKVVARGEGSPVKIRIPLRDIYDTVKDHDIVGGISYNMAEMKGAIQDNFNTAFKQARTGKGNEMTIACEIDVEEIRAKTGVEFKLT